MAILEMKEVSRHFEVKAGMVAKYFKGQPNRQIKAVESVNFSLEKNEVLGIAGESGCGKSTCCMMIAGLLQPSSGEIIYNDKGISQLNAEESHWYRSQVQMIFQDPYESLNPRFSVFDTVAEGPRALKLYPETEIADRTEEMLKSVGLSLEKYADRYPHELSGGERQRVGIASALVMEPSMVIADEPLSMLDVSIRAGILDLLKELATQRNFSCIYVSHDLSILGHIADRLMIMYLGQAMEIGPTWDVIENPKHPYTRALINAVPIPDPRVQRPIPNIKGDISRPIDPPPGCRFQKRCPHADQSCTENFITLQATSDNQHQAACHRLDSIQ
jgi:oligopeptide/dipeptide ABC transporter ATP-binding protein